jgi:predicted nucleotidyltransferase
MGRDSDIDLLILESSPENTRKESTRIRETLRGLGFPFDVIVMSTEWFEDSKNVIGGIAYPAHKYGKVIYEAACCEGERTA